MVENVLWFKHQSAATNDAKIKKLIIRHGAVGYAVYFHCLELITGDFDENNITFELEHDSEIIADNLKIQGSADKSGLAIVEEIMRTIVALDLFTENNGHIHCFKLLKNIDSSMTSNPKLRSMIVQAKENHDTVMIHHDKVMQDEKRLEETRTDKKNTKSSAFSKPTIDDVRSYCLDRGNKVDAQAWFDHYTANGWKVGRSSMKDWQAAVRTWERTSFPRPSSPKQKISGYDPSKPGFTSELL